MALYEYQCPDCGERFEKRMPMSDALQLAPCPGCGAQARKIIGNFAVVGRAEAGVGDGPAPWEDGGDGEGDGDGDLDAGGMDDLTHHGHSHGPGGHSHPTRNASALFGGELVVVGTMVYGYPYEEDHAQH